MLTFIPAFLPSSTTLLPSSTTPARPLLSSSHLASDFTHNLLLTPKTCSLVVPSASPAIFRPPPPYNTTIFMSDKGKPRKRKPPPLGFGRTVNNGKKVKQVVIRHTEILNGKNLTRKSLFPPPKPGECYPPIVYTMHLRAPYTGWLSELIHFETDLPLSMCKELIEFGAVWLARAQNHRFRGWNGVFKPSLSATDWIQLPFQSQRHILRDEPSVDKHTLVKVFVNPKRYLHAYNVDWKKRIIENNPAFVVVNKPYAVPSVPTIDNFIENVLKQVTDVLKLPKHLIPVTRLDTSTTGVVIYAKNQDQATNMLYALAQDNCPKTFRILATNPVPLGPLRHCAYKRRGEPLRYRAFHPMLLRPLPGRSLSLWAYVECEVVKCTPVFGDRLYDVEVKLDHGRYHQLRLQMACIGSYIFGDTKYKPINGKEHRGARHLESFNTRVYGEDPLRIGLHCQKIEFELGNVIYEYDAGAPWWESKVGAQQVKIELEQMLQNDLEKELQDIHKFVSVPGVDYVQTADKLDQEDAVSSPITEVKRDFQDDYNDEDLGEDHDVDPASVPPQIDYVKMRRALDNSLRDYLSLYEVVEGKKKKIMKD